MTKPPPQVAEWEKFSTYLPKGQRQQLRARAVLEGKEVREIIAALVKNWLEGTGEP